MTRVRIQRSTLNVQLPTSNPPHADNETANGLWTQMNVEDAPWRADGRGYGTEGDNESSA